MGAPKNKPSAPASEPGEEPTLATAMHRGLSQELTSILFLAKCVEQKLARAGQAEGDIARLNAKIAGAAGRAIDEARDLVHRFDPPTRQTG